MANFESYGKHVFKGKVAAPYLEKHGLDAQTLDTSAWTHTMDKADKVSSLSFVVRLRPTILDYLKSCHFNCYQFPSVWFISNVLHT